MAKITKKQEQTYVKLIALHHELIKAKHFNDKNDFEAVVEKIKEVVGNVNE